MMVSYIHIDHWQHVWIIGTIQPNEKHDYE